MDLTHEDVQNILKIIDGSSLEELHLEIGDFKLVVRKRRGGGPSADGAGEAAVEASIGVGAGAAPGPAASPRERGAAPAGAPPTTPARPPAAGGVELKAPMVGTFYRAPAPDAPPFVEEGRVVDAEDTVCIIEVMKLMNSIKAGRRGRVVSILAENGVLVEYGQALMVIEPLECTS